MNKYIKKILLNLTICSSILFLSGCYREITMSIDDIEAKITKSINLDNMEKGNDKLLRRYFGINPNDLEDYIFYYPKSNMDVDEILILKVKDLSKVDSIEESIENRVNTQLESFSGYGVEQTALLENYEINIKGKYVFYAVSKDAEKLKDDYKEIIKNK